MMKFRAMTIVLAALTCVLAFADTNVAAPEKPQRKKGEFLLRRTGGMIRKDGSAQGKVVILNAQKRVADTDFAAALGEIEKRLHPQLEVKPVESLDMTAVSETLRAVDARVGVVLVDIEKGVPALLSAPEEGWASVNVAALAKDAPAADVLASRVRKEILRAFALAAGGAFMSQDPIVTRVDIRTAKDLDMIKDEMYGVDICRHLSDKMPLLGVTPWKVTSYRVACQEGWAPQPTNDYQKAIWNELHTLPAAPLPLVKPTK